MNKNSFNTLYWEDFGVYPFDKYDLTKFVLSKTNSQLFPNISALYYSKLDLKKIDHQLQNLKNDKMVPSKFKNLATQLLAIGSGQVFYEEAIKHTSEFLLLTESHSHNSNCFCDHCNTIFKFNNGIACSFKIFEQNKKYYDWNDSYYSFALSWE